MRHIIFTEDDRQALAHYRYHHPEPRVQRKVEVLWLKSHGLGHDRIAAYAGVSRRTVQRHLNEYLEGGLQCLCRRPRSRPRSALIEHEVSLEEYFEKHPAKRLWQRSGDLERRPARPALDRLEQVARPGLEAPIAPSRSPS